MEATLVSFVQQLTGNMYPLLPGVLGSDTGSSALALADDNVRTFFIRADNGQPSRVVNVFDNKGSKVYTIERQNGFEKHWHIFSQPEQRQKAAVTIGLIKRTVDRDVPGSTDLKMSSGILGKLHRYYYDHTGNMYIWSRRSLLLQKIVNPGGESEERREGVALARLLRPGRFDWELLIDDAKVDIVTTLATAFITMRTQWLSNRLYALAAPGSRRSAVSKELTQSDDIDYVDKPVNISPDLLAYQPKEPKASPANFFNPPKFLEHKFTGVPSKSDRRKT